MLSDRTAHHRANLLIQSAVGMQLFQNRLTRLHRPAIYDVLLIISWIILRPPACLGELPRQFSGQQTAPL